jgi:hypothetical protein
VRETDAAAGRFWARRVEVRQKYRNREMQEMQRVRRAYVVGSVTGSCLKRMSGEVFSVIKCRDIQCCPSLKNKNLKEATR